VTQITEKVRIIPLGGLGEVGKNMTVLEYGEDIIIVDVGVAFPEADQPGVDLVIPDITYLKGKESRIRGIFITHGHEDHITKTISARCRSSTRICARRCTARAWRSA
jgi:ribonuclease J